MGEYNYEYFKEGMKYIETTTVEGYTLFSLGSYPGINEKKGESIVVDIMEVDETTKKRLDSMEIGAGYRIEQFEVFSNELQKNIVCDIYVYNRTVDAPNLIDWKKRKQ